MTIELRRYRDEIIQCLVFCGGMAEVEACRRLDESRLLEFEDDDERELFFHEVPYYWAMSLIHGKDNPQWYLNSALWPPPKDCYGKL